MKLRRLSAVLMLSVFCLSGCSNHLREVAEMEKAKEMATATSTSAAITTEDTAEEVVDGIIAFDSELDMSEKWEVRRGGEAYISGAPVPYEGYGFTNESGYQFACSVFLPETEGKEKCPVVVMNSGVDSSWYKIDDPNSSEQYGFSISTACRGDIMLASALNEAGIGLIIIEPFGSVNVNNTFMDIAKSDDSNFIASQDYYNDNNFTVDKAYTDVILDSLGKFSGVDPDKVILASRDYHNIAVTESAAKNQARIKGLIMIDPSVGLSEKIRKENPEKETLKNVDDIKAGMAMDYMYELYDLDLKAEAGKLNTDTKIFISKKKMKADTSVPENDKGIVNGTLATKESAEEYYPNSAPEILETTYFVYTSQPPAEMQSSLDKIVSYCKMLFKK